ncbi:MAG: sulfotransferase family protein [Actinomycetota bacterium]
MNQPTGAAAPMPNFFVIGANRAGTTSLHHYLSQHPQVYMSPVKEPNYFNPEAGREHPLWPNRATPAMTLEEYQALFAGVTGETAIGESSTVYLTILGAPERIRVAVPDARLVALLRNPIDRAFSDYSLHRSWGTESLSFADAVTAELDHDGPVAGRMRGYVRTGFYGQSLTRYLEVFERAQLRVYLYEDLMSDPDALLRDLFGFLDVDLSTKVDTTARHNASQFEAKHEALARVTRVGALRSATHRFVPRRARVKAREFLRRTNSVVPGFPDDIRRRLVEVYCDDIALTQTIVGRDLSGWLR